MSSFYDDRQPKIFLGVMLGIILGAAIGYWGDFRFSPLAMIGASLILLETYRSPGASESYIVIIIGSFFRIIGALMALGIFFGVIFGAAYFVDKFFDLPFWSGHWERFSITRDYLLQGIATVILLVAIQWFFREGTLNFISFIMTSLTFSWMRGIAGVMVVGITSLPLFLIFGLFGPFHIQISTEPPGIVLIGALVGGCYGALLEYGAYLISGIEFLHI